MTIFVICVGSSLLSKATDVTSNYMVALPLTSTRTQNILEAFQRGYLAYFGPPPHTLYVIKTQPLLPPLWKHL